MRYTRRPKNGTYKEIFFEQAPTMVLTASDYYQAFCSLG
ncbi:hypothetical protein DU19_0206 [Chlamydia muridarum]|nr:hypothetical protein DU17_0206 [Chlamydia muridarum]KDU81177.1 hypothetical protein DU18_0207 [Chlamydia muridarum]KDU82855.1 hypothetical protein DU19_0206 [Chlamydia muridarum]KDU83129.1 hypothetical protein DU20_0206 [Chlamydia muridarum]KDU84268.1 hypothetical protein DU21_0206 [Chlamydia muridarum]